MAKLMLVMKALASMLTAPKLASRSAVGRDVGVSVSQGNILVVRA